MQEARDSAEESVAAVAARKIDEAQGLMREAEQLLRGAGWRQSEIDDFLIGIRPD